MITKKSEHIGEVPNGTTFQNQQSNHSHMANVNKFCNNFLEYLRGDTAKCGSKGDNEGKGEHGDPILREYKGCKVNIGPIGNPSLTGYQSPIKQPVYYYIQPTFKPPNIPIIPNVTFLNPTQLQPKVNDVMVFHDNHYHYYEPHYQHSNCHHHYYHNRRCYINNCHYYHSKSSISKRNRCERYYYHYYY